MFIENARLSIPHLPQLDFVVHRTSTFEAPKTQFTSGSDHRIHLAGVCLQMQVHPELLRTATEVRGLPTTGVALPVNAGSIGVVLAGTLEHMGILLVDLGSLAAPVNVK